MKASEVLATSRQPLSMTSACPRFFISTISVVPDSGAEGVIELFGFLFTYSVGKTKSKLFTLGELRGRLARLSPRPAPLLLDALLFSNVNACDADPASTNAAAKTGRAAKSFFMSFTIWLSPSGFHHLAFTIWLSPSGF